MMDKKTALSKIRKLLAMAASNSPAEAEIAGRHTRLLMERFGITGEDVTLADVTELSLKTRASSRLASWEASLVNAVSKAFGCYALFTNGQYSRESGTLKFIGPTQQAELAVYTFQALRRQLNKDRRVRHAEAPMTRKVSDTWALYWVGAVMHKINALALPFKTEFAERYVKLNYPTIRTGKAHAPHNLTDSATVRAAIAGNNAGKTAQLLVPMATGAAPLALCNIASVTNPTQRELS
jgi:hypothetical protein